MALGGKSGVSGGLNLVSRLYHLNNDSDFTSWHQYACKSTHKRSYIRPRASGAASGILSKRSSQKPIFTRYSIIATDNFLTPAEHQLLSTSSPGPSNLAAFSVLDN
jgi:hypothetical protein